MIAALLLGTVVAVSAPPDPTGLDPKVEAAAAEVLDQPRFAFCHDPAYPLYEDEAIWCDHAETARERCPRLAEACGAPRAEGPPMAGRFSERPAPESSAEPEPEPGADESQPKKRTAQRSAAPPSRRDRGPSLPPLGGLAQFLFWLILVVAAIVVGVSIFRSRGHADPGAGGRETSPAADEPPTDDADGHGAAIVALSRLTSVDALLAAAQRAANQGRWREAITYGHAALLRQLDHRGQIHLHRARTSADYIRDLRQHPDVHGPVRDALREIDRAHFSARAPAQPDFESIRARVRAIVRGAGRTLGALALFAFVCLGCDGDRPAYRWGQSPSGFDATMELLRASGHEADYLAGSIASLPTPTTIVLGDGADVTEDNWAEIEALVERGGRLVLAGDARPPWWWTDVPRRWPDVWWTHEVEIPPATAWTTVRGELTLPEGRVLEEGATGSWYATRDEAPFAMGWAYGDGSIVVMAEDHLLTNVSLAMPGHATAVVDLLGNDGHAVRFVDTTTWEGATDPGDTLRQAHIVPLMLQLLFVAALLFWWKGGRFGRPRTEQAVAPREFADHARAVAERYHHAHAKDHAVAAYCTWALERLRERNPHAAQGGLSSLAAASAHRKNRDETEVMRWLVQAHSAAAQASPPEDGFALVRALIDLLFEEHTP